MKTALALPVWPSAMVTSPIERAGSGSSSVIVPRPLASPSVALTGSERPTLKVSSISSSASPLTETVTVFEVSSGAKVSVPAAAWKSAPVVAEPPAVA